jgi:hypothetical protein
MSVVVNELCIGVTAGGILGRAVTPGWSANRNNPFHPSGGALAAISSAVPSPPPISDPGRPKSLLLMFGEHDRSKMN